jgi:WD40 repeat protein
LVAAVAFTPGARRIVTLTFQGKVQLWDPATGKEKWAFQEKGLEGGLNSFLVCSPDGGRLAVGDSSCTKVVLLATATGKPNRRLSNVGGPCCAAFSPDGKTLATGDDYHRVRLWEVTTGKEKVRSAGLGGPLSRLALSPDGKTVAGGCADGTIHLWDFPSGKPRHTLEAHPGGVSAVIFARGGGLVSSGDDGKVCIWDPATGKRLRSFEAHEDRVVGLAISPDGKTIATAQGYCFLSVLLWDAATGKRRPAQLRGADGYVFGVAFSPDGKTLAGGGFSEDSEVLWVWDAKTGKRLRKLKGEGTGAGATALAFSPDGKVLAAAGWLKGYAQFDIVGTKTWKPIALTDASKSPEESLTYRVAFAPDGKRVAVGGSDGVSLWEAATGKRVLRLRGDWGACPGVVFSNDGKTLITANGDGTALFWDLATLAAKNPVPPRKD